MISKRIVVVPAVALTLALAGCGGSVDMGDMDHGGSGQPAPSAGTPSAAASGGTTTGTTTEHNAADVAFATDMIPHHRQAVDMASLAPERAGSDEVRALAADIAGAQGSEVDTMAGWLESWGEDVPEPGMDHGAMGHGSMDGAAMPGMMTAAQMDELTGATGAEFDRMFLTMMIEHHEGAIEMAATEQRDGLNTEAVALAATIEAAQTAEIATMRELLG